MGEIFVIIMLLQGVKVMDIVVFIGFFGVKGKDVCIFSEGNEVFFVFICLFLVGEGMMVVVKLFKGVIVVFVSLQEISWWL